MNPKFKNAYLKLGNSAEPIAKINRVLREQRPFTYVLETNTKTRQCSTFAKKNEAAIDAIALAAGNAFFNIRAALDYGYWQVVSPFVANEGERKKIQFPFCKEAARLTEAVKNRFAHLVSAEFFDEIIALRPYGEKGGNALLYTLEKAASPDRHRDLTPVGDYKRITSDILRQQIPDFPAGLIDSVFGLNRRDITYPARRIDVRERHIGRLIPGSSHIFEKELAVPIDVLFVIGEADYFGPAVPTLNQLSGLVRSILSMMERFA